MLSILVSKFNDVLNGTKNVISTCTENNAENMSYETDFSQSSLSSADRMNAQFQTFSEDDSGSKKQLPVCPIPPLTLKSSGSTKAFLKNVVTSLTTERSLRFSSLSPKRREQSAQTSTPDELRDSKYTGVAAIDNINNYSTSTEEKQKLKYTAILEKDTNEPSSMKISSSEWKSENSSLESSVYPVKFTDVKMVALKSPRNPRPVFSQSSTTPRPVLQEIESINEVEGMTMTILSETSPSCFSDKEFSTTSVATSVAASVATRIDDVSSEVDGAMVMVRDMSCSTPRGGAPMSMHNQRMLSLLSSVKSGIQSSVALMTPRQSNTDDTPPALIALSPRSKSDRFERAMTRLNTLSEVIADRYISSRTEVTSVLRDSFNEMKSNLNNLNKTCFFLDSDHQLSSSTTSLPTVTKDTEFSSSDESLSSTSSLTAAPLMGLMKPKMHLMKYKGPYILRVEDLKITDLNKPGLFPDDTWANLQIKGSELNQLVYKQKTFLEYPIRDKMVLKVMIEKGKIIFNLIARMQPTIEAKNFLFQIKADRGKYENNDEKKKKSIKRKMVSLFFDNMFFFYLSFSFGM